MTRLRFAAASLAIGAALLATAPATAQPAAPPPQPQAEEAIVVQGQRKAITQALRQMIAQADSEQLARFEDEICPMVIGMPRDWTAKLTKMIRDNVVAVGGKAAKPGCTVNAAVIFIDQPLDLVKALAEAEPGFFGMSPRELSKFTAAARPVTSWHVTDTFDRDGQELGQVGEIGGTPSDAKIVRQASASRLYSNIREDMLVGFVVIDRKATPGKTLRQLADLATMHLLLDVRQDAGSKDPGSILSLFEPRVQGASPPMRLSRFDRGSLAGFYTQRQNNRTASQQTLNIAKAIEKGAGEDGKE